MGARFGGCVPVPAARGNHVQPLPRRVTGIYSSIPGSPAAVAAEPCRGAPERLLRPPGSAIAAFPAGFLSGRPLRLTELAGALAGPAFLTYVNNQYSTFMPYVKNDPALFPIPALPSSRSHHIPHPMPGRGQAEGRGGSPSRQGRAKRRAERRAPPLNAGWREKRNGAGKPLTSGPDGKQNGMGTSPRSMPRRFRSWPGGTPGGTVRPAASEPDGEKKKRRFRSGPDAAPGEKHIDAGRGKCGTGRGSYRIRAGRGRRTGRGWRRGRRGARWRGLRRRRRSAPFGKAPPRRGRRVRRPP